jgi:DNA polymerase IV
MRILCLYIPHLPSQWESKRHPELREVPLVIGGYPHERKRIIDCSDEAVKSGISPGMTLRQAQHICPDAVFLPADESVYGEAFAEALHILDQFSPLVEMACLGQAFIDISGTEKLFGSERRLAMGIANQVLEQTGFKNQIGIASSKFVAKVASLASTGLFMVRKGEQKRFLELLSIELLPISTKARMWLNQLGLHTMGQVAALPENALASQLGAEGVLAHRLANGIDESPVIPRPKEDVLGQELFVSGPLLNFNALLASISRLLDELLPRLKSRYQVCAQVRLRFSFEDREPWLSNLNLKPPTDSKEELLGTLKRRLEMIQFPEGISGIHIALAHLDSEYARQTSLSSSVKGRQEEALQRAAIEMKNKFGRNPVKRIIALDPECRIPERRSALVDCCSSDD